MFYFLLLFGLPGTASMAEKTGSFIVTTFKVWICELLILLLVLLIRQILLTKYLNKMKNNNK